MKIIKLTSKELNEFDLRSPRMTPRIIKITIKEMILLTTASETIKDIWINLTEEGQNLNLAKKSLKWTNFLKTSRMSCLQ